MSKSPARQCAQAIEHVRPVCTLVHHDVCGDDVHAAGDGPCVEIMDVGDAVHLDDVAADFFQTHTP